MPPVSTKPSAEAAEHEGSEQEPRIVRARRRIGAHFYDRADVRRALALLILRRVRRSSPK